MAAVLVFVLLPSLSLVNSLWSPGHKRCISGWFTTGIQVFLCASLPRAQPKASQPQAQQLGGALCVCIGNYTAHIFSSKFNDGIAYRMCFLFRKVKEKWRVCKTRSIERIFSKQYPSSAAIFKIHGNITSILAKTLVKRISKHEVPSDLFFFYHSYGLHQLVTF